jgi:glycosyltransferase involved in cell wall biosynthesis
MSNAFPLVSVVTPTYNRRRYIPAAIECFKAQSYPMNRMEWVILDDGTDAVGDLFDPKVTGLSNVRYVRIDTGKMTIGSKRNKLTDLATGDICVCWDDDDYYPPDRVKKAVQRLRSVKDGKTKAPIAGASQAMLYYTTLDEIYMIGPFIQNHATNGTMAYWRSYALENRYDEEATKAEERKFTKEWATPLLQMDPRDVMLVICHNENTVSKMSILERPPPGFRKTTLKLKNIVKSETLREMYKSWGEHYTVEEEEEEAPTIQVSEVPSSLPEPLL